MVLIPLSTICTTLATFLAIAACVAAEPILLVSVSGPEFVDGVQSLVLTTAVTNAGNTTLKILNDPRSIMSKLPVNGFIFKSDRGLSPIFTGVRVSYAPDVAAEAKAYTAIGPGETVSISHDLTHTYDFSEAGEGRYTIQPSDEFYVVDDVTGQVVAVNATSSTSHKVHISGNLRVPRLSRVDRRALFNGCSTSQQAALNTATTNVASMISAAYSYLSSHTSTSTRFVTWFGTFTSAHRAVVLDHFQKFNSRSVTSFTYDCTCTDSGTVAYIYPNTYGIIYLCGAFWNLPSTGEDSKVAAIFHELMHFTANGPLVDYVTGQSACKSLAISNSNQAIMNADSHWYFALNSPTLP